MKGKKSLLVGVEGEKRASCSVIISWEGGRTSAKGKKKDPGPDDKSAEWGEVGLPVGQKGREKKIFKPKSSHKGGKRPGL